MREIVIDTETTGLDFTEDRVIEIGCVEVVDYIPTGETFHAYINPTIKISKEAERIHGLTYDFLKRKPTFGRVVTRFLDFIGDDPLVAHNADFDISMLNAELARVELPPLVNPTVNTLQLAREVKKTGFHSLDALCKYYGIDNSKREKHGALLDAEILAKIYLELRGGRQIGFDLIVEESETKYTRPDYGVRTFKSRLTDEEAEAHKAFVEALKNPIWLEYLGGMPDQKAA
jgi:DNA polymerase-3 subunit epsilon